MKYQVGYQIKKNEIFYCENKFRLNINEIIKNEHQEDLMNYPLKREN